MTQIPPDTAAPVVIAPPTVEDTPDQYTRKATTYVKDGAPNQVFRFCRWGIEYGTDDKGHAASILLSLALLALLLVVFILGTIVDRPWIADALKIIGPALTFTAGVAIGKGSGSSKAED